MKKTFLAILSILSIIALAIPAIAQTKDFAPSTPTVDTQPASSTASAPALDQVKQAAKDAYNILSPLSFDEGIVVEPFGLYHKGDYGGGLAVSTASTNLINYGFALATISDHQHLDSHGKPKWQFYDAALSISIGKDFNIPWFKFLPPVHLYAETGPALNLAHPTSPLIQSIAGGKMLFKINDKNGITLGGGILNNSEWGADISYIAHASWVYKPKGW